MIYFMPPATKLDPKLYTDKDGKVNEDRKQYCMKVCTNIKHCAKDNGKFQEDWLWMYHRIMGQLCPEMSARLARSDEFKSISQNSDPGRLMSLLQTVCLHGSDKEYYPEKLILSLKEQMTRKQGNNNPADFSKQTVSNNAVFAQVAELVPGTTFWGLHPGLQKFVISKFTDEFTFKHEDLASQPATTKALLYQKCDDVIMGCLMTVISNQSRSNMYIEVHKLCWLTILMHLQLIAPL